MPKKNHNELMDIDLSVSDNTSGRIETPVEMLMYLGAEVKIPSSDVELVTDFIYQKRTPQTFFTHNREIPLRVPAPEGLQLLEVHLEQTQKLTDDPAKKNEQDIKAMFLLKAQQGKPDYFTELNIHEGRICLKDKPLNKKYYLVIVKHGNELQLRLGEVPHAFLALDIQAIQHFLAAERERQGVEKLPYKALRDLKLRTEIEKHPETYLQSGVAAGTAIFENGEFKGGDDQSGTLHASGKNAWDSFLKAVAAFEIFRGKEHLFQPFDKENLAIVSLKRSQ